MKLFLTVVVWVLLAPLGLVKCVVAYVVERLRLVSRTRAAEQASVTLGQRRFEMGQAGELHAQIASLDPQVPAQRRQREALLRQLAIATLRLAEPPPGLGHAYRDFRRSLLHVGESRRRAADCWPRDWATRGQFALGLVVLVSVFWLAVGGFSRRTPRHEIASVPVAETQPEAEVATEPPPEKEVSQPRVVDRTDPTPLRDLIKDIALDLSTDPRPTLQVQGSVEWEAGKLTLGAAGSVRQELDLLGQVKFTLRLEWPPLNQDGQESLTRFSFRTRNRGDYLVEIQRRREAGKVTGEVRLLDVDAPHFAGPRKLEKQTTTLAISRHQGEYPDSLWTFRHHFGLVSVYCGDTQMVVGHAAKEPVRGWRGKGIAPAPDEWFFQKCGISEPLEIASWSLEEQKMPLVCSRISGVASPSYREGRAAFWQGVDPNSTVEERHDLRARLDRRVRHGGNVDALDSVQREFVPWENGEPDFREHHTDDKLVYTTGVFGKKHHYYALAVAGVGMQFFWMGNKDEVARRLLKQAAEISEQSLGLWHPDCVLIHSLLARIFVKTGDLEPAEVLVKKLVTAAEASMGTESECYAVALADLALVQQYNGRLAEAEATLRRSVEIRKNAPIAQQANALMALGELQVFIGERERAATALKKAQDLLAEQVRKLKESAVVVEEKRSLDVPFARARVQRAWLLFQGGQKDQARQLTRAAFLDIVQFWNTFGGGPGRFPGWNQEINNATPDLLLYNHPGFGAVMLDIAELFMSLGDTLAATGAIRVLDQVPGQTHHERAAIYRIMGRLTAAKPNVNIGLQPQFSERMRLDVAFDRLQSKLPPNAPKPDRAEYWQKQAQAELEKFVGREHPDTVKILHDRARRQWRLHGAKEAEPILRDAFARAVVLSNRVLPGLPEAQAYQFLEANRPSVDLMLSCFRAVGGQEREVYEMIWNGKALATRQLTERRQLLQAASRQPKLAKLANELQLTRQRLAQLSIGPPLPNTIKRQEELTQRKEDLERELAQASEPMRRARESSRAQIGDMVRQLPAKTAVVDFVERWQTAPPAKPPGPWTRTRCYDAFVLRPAMGDAGWSVSWVTLEDADGLDKLLESWVSGMLAKRRADSAQSDALRRKLWTPIESALGDCNTVILIPDGGLAQLPWAALPGKRPDSYLIEEYALAQAPYGQYVASLFSESKPQGDGFLLVGGVDYGSDGKWNSLPGTRAEVQELERLRQGTRTIRLSDEVATRGRVLKEMPGRRYVHLATHGEFIDANSQDNLNRGDRVAGGAFFDVTARNPLLMSKLVLAGANAKEEAQAGGYLAAEEVMGVDLSRTELVVLSACETGIGRVKGGEGVFSLQRAFHIGGSRAVVASLWQIPDKATQQLMLRFYANLWTKKMPKLEALREAQLWMLREAAKQSDLVRGGLVRPADSTQVTQDGSVPPYYWAAFVLSGDWL